MKRWSRPAEHIPARPGEAEACQAALLALTPTDGASLAEHVALAQRVQDLLTLEGVDFFWDEAGSRPIPHVEPWNERHVFNNLMADGKTAEAYARLDAYLAWLKQYIGWYYADGTLAERSDRWTDFGALLRAERAEDCVRLTFARHEALELRFTDGGFRLKSECGGGRFSVPADPILESADGVFSAGDRSVEIRTGGDWSVCLSLRGRRVFTLNRRGPCRLRIS